MSLDNNLLKSENTVLVSNELAKTFLALGNKVVEFAEQVGVNIVLTHNEELPLFRKMALLEQVRAVKKMEANYDIFAALVRDKEDVTNPAAVVWMACSRFGLRPPSDFFDKLSDDDVVEVYSEDNIHRFSNFKFFEKCSYTLEQLYTLPWQSLWLRRDVDNQYLFDCAAKVLSPAQKTTLSFNDPSHRILEVSSVFKFESDYRLKCAAPLFDRKSGLRNGYIVCETSNVLTKRTPQEEERMLLHFEKEAIF